MKNTILILDDDEQCLELISIYSEELGFRYICVNNSLDAINIYNENKNTIICCIIDYIMPGCDGIGVATEILKINNFEKIVISSGYFEIDKYTAINILGCLKKPYGIKEFKNMLIKIGVLNDFN